MANSQKSPGARSKIEEQTLPGWPVLRALTNPGAVLGVPQEMFLLNIGVLTPLLSILILSLGFNILFATAALIAVHAGMYWLSSWDPHVGKLLLCLYRQWRKRSQGSQPSKRELLRERNFSGYDKRDRPIWRLHS